MSRGQIFSIHMIATNGVFGTCDGIIGMTQVSYAPVVWQDGGDSDDRSLMSVVVEVGANPPLVISNKAWQTISADGCLDDFMRLSMFSPRSANEAVKLAESMEACFRTVVTRDVTQSARVYTASGEQDAILAVAGSSDVRWARDTIPPSDPYLAEGFESIHEIGVREIVAEFLQDAQRQRLESQQEESLKLAQQMASFPVWNPGDVGAPPGGVQGSHLALMDLITRARAIVDGQGGVPTPASPALSAPAI